LIGPGFGLQSETQLFIEKLLEYTINFPPLVIDADGLKLISKVSVKEAIKMVSKENNIKQKPHHPVGFINNGGVPGMYLELY
jgi:hypothetical protein